MNSGLSDKFDFDFVSTTRGGIHSWSLLVNMVNTTPFEGTITYLFIIYIYGLICLLFSQ